jgi:hypothetical protein
MFALGDAFDGAVGEEIDGAQQVLGQGVIWGQQQHFGQCSFGRCGT